jgi:hypothetical protein
LRLPLRTVALILPSAVKGCVPAAGSPEHGPDYDTYTTLCGVVQHGRGRPVTWTVDYGGANCNNSNGIIGYQHAEALGS